MLQLTRNYRIYLYLQFYRNVATKAVRSNLSSSSHRNDLDLSSDRDIFGTLSESGSQALNISKVEKYYPNDKDGYDKEEFDLDPKKHPFYYKYKITEYARQGSVGLRKALELFATMKSKDRQTPTLDHFSPLIYGCAKAGYTKKAFELYKESLVYYDKPTKSTVTSLINACAESPFPEYGIKRLNWFREHLKFEYNYKLNKVQYRCAIKAYGKLGQLEEASKLVQEMIDEGIMPDTSTLNMLLIGCASNREAGAILALRIYKRMQFYGFKPDIYTYCTMLRCIRDCGMGSKELIQQTIGELPAITSHNERLKYKRLSTGKKSEKNQLQNFEWLPVISEVGRSLVSLVTNHTSGDGKVTDKQETNVKLIEQKTSHNHLNLIEQDLTSSSSSSLISTSMLPQIDAPLPNLLSDNHLHLMSRIQAIQVDKLKSSANRLMLFGGLHGYLEFMMNDGCPPDNKTFGLLLDCVRQSKEQQLEYFRLAKDYKIKRDLLFYDQLIRHICSNFKDKTRLERSLKYVENMLRDDVRPNISTFAALALGCDNWRDAKKLLDDVEQCGFVTSDAMLSRLFEIALWRSDLRYLNKLIELAKVRGFEPRKKLIEALESKRLECHDLLLKHEKKGVQTKQDETTTLKGESNSLVAVVDESYIKLYDKFTRDLGNWLKSIKLEEEEHPWSQFNVESTAKRMGYVDFVKKFKKLENLKQEALKSGKSFGNLAAKAGINERDD